MTIYITIGKDLYLHCVLLVNIVTLNYLVYNSSGLIIFRANNKYEKKYVRVSGQKSHRATPISI